MPISDSGSSWQRLLVGIVGIVGQCRSHSPDSPKDHCFDRISQTELSLAKHSFQIKTWIRTRLLVKIQPNLANPFMPGIKSALDLEILKPCMFLFISWCMLDLKELKFACLSISPFTFFFVLLNMNRPNKIPKSYCHLHMSSSCVKDICELRVDHVAHSCTLDWSVHWDIRCINLVLMLY